MITIVKSGFTRSRRSAEGGEGVNEGILNNKH